jgi:N-formylglutamate deformylase
MSIPHLGTAVPGPIGARLTDAGRALPDTDWALDRLYDFGADLGLYVITPVYSRYVVDLNRPPDGAALYPGANNTELVPTTTFRDEAIYLDGEAPDAAESAQRNETYWLPYHRQLEQTLGDLRRRHGEVVLFDCHSIRSQVPRFFDGRLADFNLGTVAGRSCSPALRDALAARLGAERPFTLAVDGRFQGGYITRHYGDPANGVHAFQMELSQATYADPEAPFTFSEARARTVRPVLRRMLETAIGCIAGRNFQGR